MASLKRSLTHSSAACAKLAITVPSTVARNTLRCDEKGDTYANSIYSSNGYYAKLASAFTKIANYCDKALNNTAFCSAGTKTDLQEAKKKANGQSAGCKKRMSELKNAYNVTADIVASINR